MVLTRNPCPLLEHDLVASPFLAWVSHATVCELLVDQFVPCYCLLQAFDESLGRTNRLALQTKRMRDKLRYC